jgi:MFS family permease
LDGTAGCALDDQVTTAEPAQISIREVLTPALNRLLVGVGFSSIGSGLTLSLLIVYLHEVRGLSLLVAGLALTFSAVVSFIAAPVFGHFTDRLGARPVLLLACLVEAVGVGLMGIVTTAPQAYAAAAVIAIGGAGTWPPQSALLTQLAPPAHRQRVFGLQFMLLNLGLGVGGLLGAAVLNVQRPGTFTALYAIDAVSYLAYFAAVLTLRGHGVPEPEPDAASATGSGGYREVLADARLRRYAVGAVLLLTCGYGSMEAGIPAYLTQVAHLPVNVIGIVFFFNTFVIVVVQIAVLRRVEGRRRSSLLRVVGVLWATCWLALALAAAFPPVVAAVLITLGVCVFAVGETIWSPVSPSLLNSLAPAHLRGRYNAVGSLTWNVAGAAGPGLAGLVIGLGAGVAWAIGLAAGAVASGMLLGGLRRVLTPEQDGLVRG